MAGTPSLMSRLSTGPSQPSAAFAAPSTPAAQATVGTSSKPNSSSKRHKGSHNAGAASKAAATPANPEAAAAGAHFNFMIMKVVNFMKSRNTSMFNTSDLAVYTEVRDIEFNEELVKALRAHDRVDFNVKTELWSYKPEYVIRNKEDALNRIRGYEGRGGMPYKVIEDSWTGTRTARENIEELERDGRVLVSRTIVSSTSTREPQMKMVFLDEVGKISPPVDQVFRDAWKDLKTPAIDDLPFELEKAGLRTTATAPGPTFVVQKKKGAKARQRRLKKATNTHVEGVNLNVDYPIPGSKQ